MRPYVLHALPHGYAEGDIAAIADRGYPAAGNALGTAKQPAGQHQGRCLVNAEAIPLHELHPADDVAYPGFIDALNKGGGARANIMLAMQSLADPEAAMGKDGTQRVLDNLNTRVWFRLTDDATAKLAVEGLGMTSVGREDISHSLSFGGGSGTSGGSRGGMQYVDRSLVRSEWVTGLPRGEAFVRTRGENWKLRVPLLRAVGKEEVRRMAAAFGLESVIAELKDTAEAGESGTGTANDRLREAGANGTPADNGKVSTRQANKQPAGTGTASRSAAASADGAERLRDAFGGGDSAGTEPLHGRMPARVRVQRMGDPKVGRLMEEWRRRFVKE